ncbi:hypothetical protein [Alteromonas gracilis]|uniref:hypothetical protein n=1 Tax=Alteromonas gracilis TaxID=1479524 RepID=UPI003737027A
MQNPSLIDAFLAHRLRQYRLPSEEPVWSISESGIGGVAFYGFFSSIMLEEAANRLLDSTDVRLDAIKAIKERGVTIAIKYSDKVSKHDTRGMSFELSKTIAMTGTELYALTNLRQKLATEALMISKQLRDECIQIKEAGIDTVKYADRKSMTRAVESIVDAIDTQA